MVTAKNILQAALQGGKTTRSILFILNGQSNWYGHSKLEGRIIHSSLKCIPLRYHTCMQYLRARSLFFTVLAHGKIYYPAFTQNVIIMHCPKTEYTVKERCN